jgi:formate-dependent nitrite reductase membrane component NrfD
METNNNLLILVVSILIAIFGGTVKYISELTHKKFSGLNFIVSVFISAFTGLIIGLVCQEYNMSNNMTLIITGIAGRSGNLFIDNLVKRFANNPLKPL